MKTVVIDGVEYEVLRHSPSDIREGVMCLSYRPLPKPKKTLVEIAAETQGWPSDYFRALKHSTAPIFDAIEERLKALEEAAKK